jgi:predicted 3-demethylubiquinone-9 3-methyltransferase (glyoxalase superfamily)
MDIFTTIANYSAYFLILILIAGLSVLAFIGLFYVFLLWLKFRDREEKSLNFILLQIAVPRDNETKIDAAEQMFSSLYSIKKSGFLSRFKAPNHISFELVAEKEDIRFYVAVHHKLRDLVEKQIHGAYPDAEVKQVDEYNIFTENGKVSCASMVLKNAYYYPIKNYRDLPTDPLSSITSSLAKMQEGEGAVIQFVISPAGSKWQSSGQSYISKVKSREADPEEAQYKVDPKELERIDNKVSKPGFNTAIRVVVNSNTQHEADRHLKNLTASFSQFNSDVNKFTKKKIWIKKLFMIDFIYRYQPLFAGQSVFSTEELAGMYHLPNKSVETPHIHWLAAKSAPAPAQVPKEGLFLGKSL